MKLDRNTGDGRGKYAIINLRKCPERYFACDPTGKFLLIPLDAVEWGETPVDEFFVIKLKDKYAPQGLLGYAEAAFDDGETEYAEEVFTLARHAGPAHPLCKKPD